jgi:hypothetical protein
MIFSIQDMRIFSPDELGLLFGNAEEDWSRESERSDGTEYTQADSIQRWSMLSRRITGTTSTAVRCRTWSKSCRRTIMTSEGSSCNCE